MLRFLKGKESVYTDGFKFENIEVGIETGASMGSSVDSEWVVDGLMRTTAEVYDKMSLTDGKVSAIEAKKVGHFCEFVNIVF